MTSDTLQAKINSKDFCSFKFHFYCRNKTIQTCAYMTGKSYVGSFLLDLKLQHDRDIYLTAYTIGSCVISFDCPLVWVRFVRKPTTIEILANPKTGTHKSVQTASSFFTIQTLQLASHQIWHRAAPFCCTYTDHSAWAFCYHCRSKQVQYPSPSFMVPLTIHRASANIAITLNLSIY